MNAALKVGEAANGGNYAPLNMDNDRDLQRTNFLSRSTVAIYGISCCKIGGPTAARNS
jgi:hypothetical protein